MSMADKKKTQNTNYHRYLNDEQFETLETYKHYAPKTAYENWLIGLTSHIEKALPCYWTANVITFIGNIPMFTCSSMALYYGGLNYHDPDVFLPSWLFVYSAFCVQWFSWWDCMDGQRARRLKCGTPIGRVLDEAGDMVQYTMFTIFLGYVTKVGPGCSLLGYQLINLVMYAMEVCFLITTNLTINMELIEFGPVELELFLALIIGAAGVFGNTSMINPVIASYPSMSSVFSASVTWGHCLQCLFFIMISQSVYESLEKCTQKHGYSFIYYMLAPLIIWCTAYVGAFMETRLYMEYQVLFNVLYQMIQNIQIFRLMMSNMAKVPYSIIGPENIIGFVPIIVHLMCGPDKALQSQYELVATVICIIILFVYFYGYHMSGLITQYYRRNPQKNFWYITDADIANGQGQQGKKLN